MKKQENGLIDFSSSVDPEIESAILQGRTRAAGRHLSPAQRRKAEKDRARNRLNLDMPEDLSTDLEALAAQLGVSVSSLAVYLLDQVIDTVDLAALEAAREHTRSMRFEYIMPHTRKLNQPVRNGSSKRHR